MPSPPAYPDSLLLPVKQFLTVTTCPDEWLHYNLYLFRNEATVFYVGQSDLAFARVWRHFQDGFKGRSLVGKFIRNNWPKSMNFSIRLISAASDRFSHVGNSMDRAEQFLIQRYSPCFNDALNAEPAPIPDGFLHPNENVPYPRHLGRMVREAEVAVKQQRQRDQRKAEW